MRGKWSRRTASAASRAGEPLWTWRCRPASAGGPAARTAHRGAGLGHEPVVISTSEMGGLRVSPLSIACIAFIYTGTIFYLFQDPQNEAMQSRGLLVATAQVEL